MKTIFLALFLYAISAYGDVISVPKNYAGTAGEPYLKANDGKVYKISLCQTTDSVGNVIPCVGTGAGAPIITVNQGTANSGVSPWHVIDDAWIADFDAWKVWADVNLSTRASEVTLSAFQSANHTDLLGVQTRIDSTNTKLDTVNSNLVTIQGKQDSQTTQLTAINSNTDDLEPRIGATNESAAATDTSTSGLNGLFKRLLQRITTLIAFYNSNFGADSGGIRVNAQVGNSGGAYDTGTGVTTSQTPRVNLSTTQLGQKQTSSSFSTVFGSQGLGDSIAVDAFARLRVSNPQTIFNSKQIFDNMPLFWDDQQTSGSGTSSTYSQAQASSTLAVSNLTAGTRVRQTKRRFNYQPGKSQLYMFTGVLGTAATGITRRVGAFDANNGVFFEQISTGLRVCIRSSTSGSAVDSCVAQASFNKDKVDGTGSSGVTFLPASAQIFWIDFEWLGTGRVRFGMMYRGQPIVLHEVYNSNESGISVVWASTPNFPIRYEISNSGTGPAADLVQICATVISEGGQEHVGFLRSVDRGSSGFVTASGNNDIYPCLSMRLKSTALAATISHMRVSLSNSTNANYRWGLYLNPTIAGVDAASWTSDSNTSVEYDISRTNVNKVTGGILLASGYANDLVNQISSDTAEQIKLGSTIAGVSDQLVLTVQTVGGTTAETYFCSASFLEDL